MSGSKWFPFKNLSLSPFSLQKRGEEGDEDEDGDKKKDRIKFLDLNDTSWTWLHLNFLSPHFLRNFKCIHTEVDLIFWFESRSSPFCFVSSPSFLYFEEAKEVLFLDLTVTEYSICVIPSRIQGEWARPSTSQMKEAWTSSDCWRSLGRSPYQQLYLRIRNDSHLLVATKDIQNRSETICNQADNLSAKNTRLTLVELNSILFIVL